MVWDGVVVVGREGDWDRMDETSVNAEDVRRRISELETRHTDSQIGLFDRECSDGDQGSFYRKLLINAWLRVT